MCKKYLASRNPNFSSGMRTNPVYSCKMGKTSGFPVKPRVFSQSACWGKVDCIPLHAEQSVLSPWFTHANPWFPGKQTPVLLKHPICSNPWFTREPVNKNHGFGGQMSNEFWVPIETNLLNWHPYSRYSSKKLPHQYARAEIQKTRSQRKPPGCQWKPRGILENPRFSLGSWQRYILWLCSARLPEPPRIIIHRNLQGS